MVTAEQMSAAVHAYVAAFESGDPEAAVALFAANAIVEDPVGTPAKQGLDAIRAFYVASMQTGAKLHLEGPIRVGPDYAAFAFQVRLSWEGNTTTIDVIDVFRFDQEGRIVKMEAYFGPGNFSAAN